MMSDNSNQNDPTMKEILGSIRRIINEDNAQTGAENAGTGEDEDTLDLTDEVDWAEVHSLIEGSYRLAALKRMLKALNEQNV